MNDCTHCGATGQDSLFCRNCGSYIPDATGTVEKVTFNRRFWGTNWLEGLLFLVTLGIGWLIWLGFTASTSQTPAKRLLNVYTLDINTGQPVSGGRVWVREVLVKIILFGLILSTFLPLIIALANGLWVLFDKNRQALHDKIVGTIVVYAPRGLPESMTPATSQIGAFEGAFGNKAESPSEAIASLSENIVTTALLSTQPVNEGWPVKPMPAEANFVVRIEMLMFIIHMVNRFALTVAGTEAMAALRREVVDTVMPSVIKASFDTRSVKPGFDADEWQQRMINDTLGMLDEAELEYSECKDLAGDMMRGLWSDDIIVGRLVNRIFESADVPDHHDIVLRTLIGSTAVRVLARSGLKEQAEEAARVIAKSSV